MSNSITSTIDATAPVNSAPQSGASGATLSNAIRTTMPKQIIRHNISDEELDVLVSGKTDRISEATWAFIGGAIGSLIPVIRHIYNSYGKNGIPLSIIELLEVVFFGIYLALSICLILVKNIKGKPPMDLLEEIRRRKTIS